MLVFGTRPEAIKMCPLIKEMKQHKELECCVCLTGQHKEMLEPVMQAFGIVEDYNLNIMKEGQTLADITVNVISELSKILNKEKPDWVMVHGDTTSAFAAATASFYLQVPIAHVEAGLRTGNIYSPYPEEFNRQAIDLITDIYFAPTYWAKENLINEGKEAESIYVTGNTVIDALRTTIKENYTDENIQWASDSKMILLTTHRRENLGEEMENIFKAVNIIVNRYPNLKFIFPVHKNPKIREIVKKHLNHDRIRIIEPLDVIAFHNYMNKSYLIMTDSGGIQEEAPALGKPVLVLRNTTERPEGISAGTLKLVGTETENIVKQVSILLDNKAEYEKMSKAQNPYGDGHASERIIASFMEKFKDAEGI